MFPKQGWKSEGIKIELPFLIKPSTHLTPDWFALIWISPLSTYTMHDPENYDRVKLSYMGRNVAADTLLVPQLNAINIRGGGKHRKILDFGCGTGLVAHTYLLPLAEETDSTIVGLDVSEEMVAYAKANYKNERLSYVRENIMANDSKLPDSEFDYIVSFLVLHFIQDYREAFKQLYKMLKPGRKCAFVVCSMHDQFPSYKLLGSDPKWSQYMQGYEEFLPDWTEPDYSKSAQLAVEKVGKAAADAGFEIIECANKFVHIDAESFTEHIDFVLTLNPFIKQVPKELLPELHRSLTTHICRFYGFPDTPDFHAKPYSYDYNTVSLVMGKPL